MESRKSLKQLTDDMLNDIGDNSKGDITAQYMRKTGIEAMERALKGVPMEIEEITDPKRAKEIMDKLREDCFFSFKFEMNDNEKAKARDWIKNHNCKEYFSSSTGEQYAYEFIPGGLCDMVKVSCIFCKESIDVTDVEGL